MTELANRFSPTRSPPKKSKVPEPVETKTTRLVLVIRRIVLHRPASSAPRPPSSAPVAPRRGRPRPRRCGTSFSGAGTKAIFPAPDEGAKAKNRVHITQKNELPH